MRSHIPAGAAALILVLSAPCLAGDVDLPRFPSIRPDGEEVVFSWRGDLWKAPTAGGLAARLTSHPAVESRSAWSGDGKRIAFNSDRSGALNVMVMDADGGNVREVTREDDACLLAQYGADGRITFQASREGDVYRDTRPYWVRDTGGPIHRVHDAFGRAPQYAQDGGLLLFTRGGSSWMRRHYRGPDARDVWSFDPAAKTFRQLTHWAGNDGQALFDGRGGGIYMSDQELATVNLYRLPRLDGTATPERLTSFEGTDVWDFDVTPDGRTAVLQVWDALYRLDLTTPGARPARIPLTAPDDEGDAVELVDVSSKVSEARLSPDGKTMAYVAYGEVYVRNVDDDHPTRRVTDSIARERDVVWSPDGLRLYFASDRDGTQSIFEAVVELSRSEIRKQFDAATKPAPEVKPETPAPKDDATAALTAPDTPKVEKPAPDPRNDPDRWHDAVSFTVRPVVQGAQDDRDPRPSPDGSRLAFRRGRGDLCVRDLATGAERVLRAGWDTGLDFRWSPDGRFIAFQQDDRNFNADIYVVPSDGSAPPVNVTRHPANDYSPRWSADGRILTFISERHAREFDVYLVILDKRIEALPPLELEQYFKDSAAAAKKRKPLPAPGAEEKQKPNAKKDAEDTTGDKQDEPVHLDLDDAYKRLRRVTTLPGNETNVEITPAGDRVVFTGANGTDAGLFSIGWDGKDLKKLGATGAVQHVSLTGDAVVFVAGGRASTVDPKSGGAKVVALSDTLRVDLAAQYAQDFSEAAHLMGEVFYHPTLKGLDWPALSARYLTLAARARTGDEFNDVANRFLGELNGSHLGIRAKGYEAPIKQPNGRLGIDVLPVETGLRVERVVPYGPADKGDMRLTVGDVITEIELEPLAPGDTLLSRLRGRVGDETIVTVQRTDAAAGGTKTLRVLITPVSDGADTNLRYDAWQAENARRVHEWSGGRIGYIHVRGMNEPSLEEYERDLFAAAEGHEGLLVDVRNNGGGYTADRLLASIMVTPHAYTVPRGADPAVHDGYPQDRLFIQRYVMPMNMLCNEKSFSNAEIVAHAFKTLGRGSLVGQQTYGGVISTGGTALVDGTFVRLPFRGWYLPDGTDMENHGAVPDVLVPQTPEAESLDRDDQLKAAVDDLLKRL